MIMRIVAISAKFLFKQAKCNNNQQIYSNKKKLY